jgi:nitronate monooxygenase
MKYTRRSFIETSAAAGALLASVGAQNSNADQSPRNAVAMPPPRAKALMALFNLKYPIFEAAHGNATRSELAIAVSNAGAMGALTLTGRPADTTRTVVSQVRAGTKGPFLVNYILNWEPATLEVALDAGAPVVHFSWGMPTSTSERN